MSKNWPLATMAFIVLVISLYALPGALKTIEEKEFTTEPDKVITGIITDVEYLEGGLLNTPVTKFTLNNSRIVLVRRWKSDVKINGTYSFYYRPGEANPYKIKEIDP